VIGKQTPRTSSAGVKRVTHPAGQRGRPARRGLRVVAASTAHQRPASARFCASARASGASPGARAPSAWFRHQAARARCSRRGGAGAGAPSCREPSRGKGNLREERSQDPCFGVLPVHQQPRPSIQAGLAHEQPTGFKYPDGAAGRRRGQRRAPRDLARRGRAEHGAGGHRQDPELRRRKPGHRGARAQLIAQAARVVRAQVQPPARRRAPPARIDGQRARRAASRCPAPARGHRQNES
jgi:hypothetical protein